METVSGSNPLDNIRWQQETPTPEADANRGMLTQEDFFALLTK